MKIQFYGGSCFSLTGKNTEMVFDPNEDFVKKYPEVDFATDSGKAKKIVSKLKTKKVFSLPGEFETSGALVRGFYTEKQFSPESNIVFKVVLEDIACVHFDSLQAQPDTTFFEALGENIDVIMVNLGEKFGVKEVKALIETLEPRWAIIGGDQALFPKMIESGAKLLQENSVTLSASSLNEEKTEMFILSV